MHAPEEFAAVVLLHVPEGHAWQTSDDLAPTTALNVPAGQASQDDAPGYAAYDPAAQSTHCDNDDAPTLAPNVPGRH